MTGMSVFVTNMASMIGIGVAVDYSLFVLARYREEIAAGREPGRRARDRARHLRRRRHVLGPDRDRLARRAVHRRHDVGALDGARRDPRRRRLGARRDDAAAGADLRSPAGARRSRAASLGGVTARRARAAALRRGGAAPSRGALLGALDRRDHAPPGARGGRLRRRSCSRSRSPRCRLQMRNGALQQFPHGHETRVGVEAAARSIGAGAASPVEVVAPRGRARAGAADAAAPTARSCASRRRCVSRDGADGARPRDRRATTASRRRRARSSSGCATSCPRGAASAARPPSAKDFVDRISELAWG